MKNWITCLIVLMLAAASYAGQRTPPAAPALEPGPQMQFWHIHTFYTKERRTIDVLKFQVGKTMVCKAVYYDRDREKVVEENLKSASVALAMAIATTSLGDVPCD